jgi:hypothetical protein
MKEKILGSWAFRALLDEISLSVPDTRLKRKRFELLFKPILFLYVAGKELRSRKGATAQSLSASPDQSFTLSAEYI